MHNLSTGQRVSPDRTPVRKSVREITFHRTLA
jgi:hypothetical protein